MRQKVPCSSTSNSNMMMTPLPKNIGKEMLSEGNDLEILIKTSSLNRIYTRMEP